MLSVAQFRHTFFTGTETFLYNYLTAFKRVLPVGITFRNINRERFPFEFPMVVLYRWDYASRAWRRGLRFFLSQDQVLKYDQSKTYDAIRKFDIDILHAHFGYTGSQVLSIKASTGIPLITTFYGEDVSALAKIGKWRKAYQQLFNIGDLFLVEGLYMHDRLIEIGCLEDKVKIQRIAIEVDKYPHRTRQTKSKDEKVHILFCGRFQEKKGLNYALDAVRRAYDRRPNLEFRIIGDGESRSQIEQTIRRHSMDKYTRLLGFQYHERVIAEMNKADILLAPSVTARNGDSEGGAPTTILEAQACGLPILSTTHADIPNVVIPGESALLAPERDGETLGNILLELINHSEKWARMGKIGRYFVERYHNIDTEINLLEDRYLDLVNNSI
jgi:colanic acid/amylovoran biosynthesis glycosyltransferase